VLLLTLNGFKMFSSFDLMFLDYYLLIIDFKPIITLAFVVFLTQLITISLPNNLIVSNICHETHNF